MEHLTTYSVEEFTTLLASSAPAPGGGSTAALQGALGAALTQMVCALTQNRKKYAEFSAHAADTEHRVSQIREALLSLVEEDTAGFRLVSAAYALPKATAEEQCIRRSALQSALRVCTQTPLSMLTLSLEALELTEGMLHRFNTNTASDLGCAALSLKAAMQGAWLNVLINTADLEDRGYAVHARQEGEALLAQGLALADRIYDTLQASLR